jgi:hypothetical protein
MPESSNSEGALAWTVGALLLIVGIVFFVLAAIFVALSPLDWKMTLWAATWAIGFGALLVCVGWWVVRPEEVSGRVSKIQIPLDAFLTDHRGLLEGIAASGFALMAVQVVALCIGEKWPADAVLATLVACFIVIDWRARRILRPELPESNVISYEEWMSWPAWKRWLAVVLSRAAGVSKLGLGVYCAFWGFQVRYLSWRPTAQIVASSLACLLYAWLILLLRVGDFRQPTKTA